MKSQKIQHDVGERAHRETRNLTGDGDMAIGNTTALVRKAVPLEQCIVVGDFIRETAKFIIAGHRLQDDLVTCRYGKDRVHLSPCPRCPDYGVP